MTANKCMIVHVRVRAFPTHCYLSCSYVFAAFGSLDCPDVTEPTAPPRVVTSTEVFVGQNKVSYLAAHVYRNMWLALAAVL